MDKNRMKMMMTGLLLAAICSPVLTQGWKASVVKSLEVVVSSCVVIPCTFTHPEGNLPTSRLRPIWHFKSDWNRRIYFDDKTTVVESFRDRTELLGHLGQGNCTLEITDVKDHDNGPFCFRIELTPSSTGTLEKFSFVEDCAELRMLPDPPKPKLIPSKTAIQGLPFTIACTVTHTCPSRAPILTWSRGTPEGITEVHRQSHSGIWEVQSILTFIPEEKDDHSEVTCTSTFNGGRTSSATFPLYVKRTENYNHIIIPTVVGISTAVVFTVFCVFMVKRYKARIAQLQSQDGSVWNRLSRLSRRLRPDVPGPFRSEQRRSIWSRFSRRPRAAVEMPNAGNSKTHNDQAFSKPRFPSPKSQPKSCNYNKGFDGGDDYENTADLNVYGNV